MSSEERVKEGFAERSCGLNILCLLRYEEYRINTANKYIHLLRNKTSDTNQVS